MYFLLRLALLLIFNFTATFNKNKIDVINNFGLREENITDQA
jgi:hypothetical protein